MEGVYNDAGHDDSSANSLPHSRDINPDLSKAPEFYCCDIFNCRRPCRFDSLTLPDCLCKLTGCRRGEEVSTVLISYRGKEACRETTGHSSTTTFLNRRDTDSHCARIIEPNCYSVSNCGQPFGHYLLHNDSVPFRKVYKFFQIGKDSRN